MSDIFTALKKLGANVVSVVLKYARRKCQGPDDGSACEGDGWCPFDKETCEHCERYYRICDREGCYEQLGKRVYGELHTIHRQNRSSREFEKTFCPDCYLDLRKNADPLYPYPEYYDSDSDGNFGHTFVSDSEDLSQ